MSDGHPLVPAAAHVLRERGTFELDVQHCEVDLLRLLGAGTGKHPDVHRYRMPVDVDAETVFAFYAGQLQPRWRRIFVPEHHGSYRLAMWRRRPLFRWHRMAIALLDDMAVGSTSASPFRVLVVALEPGNPAHRP